MMNVYKLLKLVLLGVGEVFDVWLFSSPEPLGSQGELIGWP